MGQVFCFLLLCAFEETKSNFCGQSIWPPFNRLALAGDFTLAIRFSNFRVNNDIFKSLHGSSVKEAGYLSISF
jgi:hypothetical protein